MKKDDETAVVVKTGALPGQHAHLPVVAGVAFAGAGFIALIAAVAFALRAHRISPSNYEQTSRATTPTKCAAAEALLSDGASQVTSEPMEQAQ